MPRTQTVNRLHRLLLELLAGGPKKDLSAKQARELIVTIKPRDLPGKTRRRLAVELIGERESIDRKIKTGDKEIEALVLERDSTLMDLFGIAAASAVRLLVDVGDIHRFANRDRFASWNGTAPLDVSSGNPERHRLSRVGNRRINRTIHTMAINQLRHRTEGRAFYDRQRAGGMPSMMALRVLNRRLSNVIFARMLADQTRREARVATGPGGHSGNDSVSSAVDSHLGIDSSEKPHPASTKARTGLLERAALSAAACLRVDSLLRLIDAFDTEIDPVAKITARQLANHPGYTAVQTLPGVGPILAAVFVTEIGDITRFPAPARPASWAGLTPRHYESDTIVYRGRISKQGSRLVRWAAIRLAVGSQLAVVHA